MKSIPLSDSAVLIWLAEGESPMAAEFDQKKLSVPPYPNPEPWWTAKEAIEHAHSTWISEAHAASGQGKVPWIKIGSLVLSPTEIRESAELIQRLVGAPGRL
jgi:hypothetical protein